MATDHRPLKQAEERELKALEAGLAGKPVDADLAELAALAADLNAGRPQPDPLFAAELDQAVTDGFPPEWSVGRSRRRRQGFFGRLGSSLGFDRQSFAPLATGLAGLLIVVVAAGIAFEGGGSDGPGGDDVNPQNTVSSADSAQAGAASGAEAVPQAATLDRAIGDGAGSGIEIYPEGRTATAATGVQDREVARNVRITLSTPSEDLQETSNRIVEVSDSYGGIIMRSSISGGDGGGRASFSLLIPSDKAEAAVAELSSVADLRSRTQQSVDITAPTVSAKQRLRTARARVESLLSELSEAPDDEARRQVGRQLYWARQSLSSLTANLERLERQVSFTPVNLAVETSGDSGSDSGWSIGDAVGDAGHLLAVSAGVAVVALAVAIPIGLMVLVALAINRAWLRRSRERALRDD